MHLASSEGHAAVVKLLIDHCTDAEHVHQLGCVADRWGQTPMLDALRGGHASVCSLLSQSGCGLGSLETEILTEQLCASSFTETEINLLQRLLDAGAEPSLADYDLRTPLHIAAAEGNTAAVQLLLQRGAPSDARDRWGRTAKGEADRCGNTELIALFKNFAKPHPNNTSHTLSPVQKASQKAGASLKQSLLLQTSSGTGAPYLPVRSDEQLDLSQGEEIL
jgi:ankyrin repeat protein